MFDMHKGGLKNLYFNVYFNIDLKSKFTFGYYNIDVPDVFVFNTDVHNIILGVIVWNALLNLKINLETAKAVFVKTYKEMDKPTVHLNLCITFPCSVGSESFSFRWRFMVIVNHIQSSRMFEALNFAMDMCIIYFPMLFSRHFYAHKS